MHYIKGGLLSACLVFTGVPFLQADPEASFLSASDLNSACANDASNSGDCSAYISGFSRGMYYAAVSSQAGFTPCIPRTLSDGQARLIVTGFMQAHSEMMQQRAPSVIAEALVSAYPCKGAAPDGYQR